MLSIYTIDPDTGTKYSVGSASPFTDSSGYHVLIRNNISVTGLIEIVDSIASRLPDFVLEIDEDNHKLEPKMYLYTRDSKNRSEKLIAEAVPIPSGRGYTINIPYGIHISGALLIHPDRRTGSRVHLPTTEERDELEV